MPRAAPAKPKALAAAPASPATTAAAKALNMVRNAPEELGRVPDHFFWLRGGLQAVQDPLDGDLVFITDEGRITGRAALPPGFVIDKVESTDGQVRLLDSSGRRQVSVARNIDASSVKSLQALPVMANSGRQLEVIRAGPNHLILRVPSRDARWFDRRGHLMGIATVPLDGFEVVPHDFITIGGDGRVCALVPTASGVKIREYNFFRPPKAHQLNERQLRQMGRAVKEISVTSNVTGDARGFRDDGGSIKLTV